MSAIFGITLAQVDELIAQSDKLMGIYDLLLGGDRESELRISRNNFAALLGDPVFKVRDIAHGARKVEVTVSLG